jgi:hypothetical protein
VTKRVLQSMIPIIMAFSAQRGLQTEILCWGATSVNCTRSMSVRMKMANRLSKLQASYDSDQYGVCSLSRTD